MKQGHCIEDTAGFAGGGDAGGQAGGKARSTEAYRLPRGRLEKNHSTKGLGENKGKDPTSHAVSQSFSLAAVSAGPPPVVRRLLK
jgi:hypothetical protein